jgi:hypothetical protein
MSYQKKGPYARLQKKIQGQGSINKQTKGFLKNATGADLQRILLKLNVR